mgnify:CR=1 FL=1
MSATQGIAYQANFKTPAGTLLNIYAENGGDFADQLDAFPEFLAKIVAIESQIVPASVVAQHVPVAAPAMQPPQPAPAPAQGDEHLCNCGIPMRFVQAGVSKATGKPYRAFYACAQPRGQQCDKKISV